MGIPYGKPLAELAASNNSDKDLRKILNWLGGGAAISDLTTAPGE